MAAAKDKTKAAQLAKAAAAEMGGQQTDPEKVVDLPSSEDGATPASEATAKGNLPVTGAPASEAANAPVEQQRDQQELEPKITEQEPETEPVEKSTSSEDTDEDDVVDMGGRVRATVIEERFATFTGGILYMARRGDRIRATRADVDRGVRNGYLEE